jgi:hypothetical protein
MREGQVYSRDCKAVQVNMSPTDLLCIQYTRKCIYPSFRFKNIVVGFQGTNEPPYPRMIQIRELCGIFWNSLDHCCT